MVGGAPVHCSLQVFATGFSVLESNHHCHQIGGSLLEVWAHTALLVSCTCLEKCPPCGSAATRVVDCF